MDHIGHPPTNFLQPALDVVALAQQLVHVAQLYILLFALFLENGVLFNQPFPVTAQQSGRSNEFSVKFSPGNDSTV